ncbi:MAG: hypothetical protein HRU19_29670 [Pseudobacteriovorax sp.]|nr:hypothetical protein [Pseudobacteriovorax sp.]
MKSILLLTIFSIFFSHLAWSAPSQIETKEQAILYANAQNLVSRWNNALIGVKTGKETKARLQSAQIFSPKVELNFDLGAEKLSFKGLDSTESFYDGFFRQIEPLHFNWVTNVETISFARNSINIRFRHGMLINGKLSLAGDNQATIEKVAGRYVITKVKVKIIHFDIAHAKPKDGVK